MRNHFSLGMCVDTRADKRVDMTPECGNLLTCEAISNIARPSSIRIAKRITAGWTFFAKDKE